MQKNIPSKLHSKPMRPWRVFFPMTLPVNRSQAYRWHYYHTAAWYRSSFPLLLFCFFTYTKHQLRVRN